MIKIKPASEIRGSEQRIILPTARILEHPNMDCHMDQHVAGLMVTREDKGKFLTYPVMPEANHNHIPRSVDVRDYPSWVEPGLVDDVHYVWGRIFHEEKIWPGIGEVSGEIEVFGKKHKIVCVNRRLGIFGCDLIPEHRFFSKIGLICAVYEKLKVFSAGGHVFTSS